MTKATLKALNWKPAYSFRDWPTIILMPRSLAAHMALEEYLRALRLPADSRETPVLLWSFETSKPTSK